MSKMEQKFVWSVFLHLQRFLIWCVQCTALRHRLCLTVSESGLKYRREFCMREVCRPKICIFFQQNIKKILCQNLLNIWEDTYMHILCLIFIFFAHVLIYYISMKLLFLFHSSILRIEAKFSFFSIKLKYIYVILLIAKIVIKCE